VWDPEARAVLGRFLPGPHHAGYENRLHGGLLTSLLDEAMAWACAVRVGSYCVTGDLQVRFKGAVRLGEAVVISGRADGEAWGPYVRASGEARAESGELLATAFATFAAMPLEESRRLRAALRFDAGELDVLDRSAQG